jgi:hypothetical protein
MNRRIPTWLADSVIAVGLFVLAVASSQDLRAFGVSNLYSRETGAFAFVLIALQTLPLAFRRRTKPSPVSDEAGELRMLPHSFEREPPSETVALGRPRSIEGPQKPPTAGRFRRRE